MKNWEMQPHTYISQTILKNRPKYYYFGIIKIFQQISKWFHLFFYNSRQTLFRCAVEFLLETTEFLPAITPKQEKTTRGHLLYPTIIIVRVLVRNSA